MAPVTWLRERAASYMRDAEAFAACPDDGEMLVWAAVYRTIARELREAADRLEAGS